MRQVLERFAHNALALLAVTTILFFMFRLMPGSPLAAFINENLNADQQQAMLAQFGLDRPLDFTVLDAVVARLEAHWAAFGVAGAAA